MIAIAIFLLALAASSNQALQSPCPDILSYEEQSENETTRWYGQITFPSSTPNWLFLTIVLNEKAQLLGNSLGEVTTKDNIEYRITNPGFKTKRRPIRFFVKHDPEDETPPKVQLIKVNTQEICNADKPVPKQSESEKEPSPSFVTAASTSTPRIPSQQAIQSPCPDILAYEEQFADEPSRWYGQITVPSTTPNWLFITVVLNEKAQLLGNWLGEVTTKDNIEYRITNPGFKTKRKPIRFFVKHDPEDETPPKVQLIKVNAQEICNADKPVPSVNK